MSKKSAGILLYRFTNTIMEVLIVHPGGPYWAKKDRGAWSIPKGEFEDENPLEAAIREFYEETGEKISGNFIPLTPVKQSNRKTIYPFALEKDFEVSNLTSNTFSMEWPPKSGQIKEFPEIDKGEWVDIETSRLKLNTSQSAIIDELIKKLNLNEAQLQSKISKNNTPDEPTQLSLF